VVLAMARSGAAPRKDSIGIFRIPHKETGGIVREALDGTRPEGHFTVMATIAPVAKMGPPKGGIRGYAEAMLLVGVSTLIGMLIAPRWGTGPVDLIYLPAVLAAAILAGLGPALLAAVASALAYNYFFTAPYRTFRIHSPADVVTVVILFLVAAVTSHLAASIREQARIATAHAARNATIAGFARRLLTCTGAAGIAEAGVKELAGLFDCNAILLTGRPEPHVVAAEPPAIRLTPGDLAATAAVLASGEPTGRGFAPASTIEWQIHPVRSKNSTIAAVGLARDDGRPPVPPDKLPLLESLLDQMALALERAQLETEARELASLREGDRLRSTLLLSIGDDLKPRLSAIGSAAGELRRSGSADKALLSAMSSEIAKLQLYLANLLDLAPASDRKPVEVAGVKIDLFNRAVFKDGEKVHLAPKEYAVLAELARYRGRVLAHSHLLRAVWGPAQERQTEYLRVAVRSLRQKLERDPAHPKIIVNEPAVGYRLAG
jgi:K+-sensing histidine kinase KdpD